MAAELTDELAAEILEYLSKSQNFKLATKLSKALATQPPAQGAEPVGSVHRDTLAMPEATRYQPIGGSKIWPAVKAKYDTNYVLVYTSPQPAAEVEKLRKALQTARSHIVVLGGTPAPQWGDDIQRAVLEQIDAALQSDQAQAGKGE